MRLRVPFIPQGDNVLEWRQGHNIAVRRLPRLVGGKGMLTRRFV
ncbi:MAG: hypothetical protein AAFQ80_25165 [Cyanobacteria bacterium J06621_8]